MPNISDKLREFFGDPTIPGQAVEEVLMNAKEMGYGPGGGNFGDLPVLSVDEFIEFVESKGWKRGKFNWTDPTTGTTWNLGTDDSLSILNYPASAFKSTSYPLSTTCLLVASKYDDPGLQITFSPYRNGAQVSWQNTIYIGAPNQCNCVTFVMLGPLYCRIITFGLGSVHNGFNAFSFEGGATKTSHGGWDLMRKVVISGSNAISIENGKNNIKDIPSIKLGNAVLDEDNLTALLNGGGNEPYLVGGTQSGNVFTLDKTAAEIEAHIDNAVIYTTDGGNIMRCKILSMVIVNGAYSFIALSAGTLMMFTATSADAYPAFTA